MSPQPGSPARIGPNAVTRVAEAMRAAHGEAETAALFAQAGLAHHLATPPEHMVDERDVAVLHATLRAQLGVPEARRIGWQAGLLTGDYLLAHRIPKGAQVVLKVLPAPLASRVLLVAVGSHAWTFAGSGRFGIAGTRPLQIVIADGPLCRDADAGEPLCDYYAATFERLWRTLVSPRTRVVEVECQAAGAPACVFAVDWSKPA